MTGTVVRGDGLGRKLGFPTANLARRRGELPARGVYLVEVDGAGPRPRWGVCNVGVRPTVGGRRLVVEVHLPRFRGSLYGRRLAVRFVRRLRGERRFPSLSALEAQIRRDVSRAGRLARLTAQAVQ